MAGVGDATVVDLIAEEADGNVAIIMVETRSWDGGEAQETELWKKFDAYAGFVRSGMFAERNPELVDKPLEFRLECSSEPPPNVLHILQVCAERLDRFGISITYNVNEDLALE